MERRLRHRRSRIERPQRSTDPAMQQEDAIVLLPLGSGCRRCLGAAKRACTKQEHRSNTSQQNRKHRGPFAALKRMTSLQAAPAGAQFGAALSQGAAATKLCTAYRRGQTAVGNMRAFRVKRSVDLSMRRQRVTGKITFVRRFQKQVSSSSFEGKLPYSHSAM
jgi:hypothetical protein